MCKGKNRILPIFSDKTRTEIFEQVHDLTASEARWVLLYVLSGGAITAAGPLWPRCKHTRPDAQSRTGPQSLQ